MNIFPLTTKHVIILSVAWVILFIAWVLITTPDGYSLIEYIRYADEDEIIRQVYSNDVKEPFFVFLTVPPICLFLLNMLLKLFIKP